MYCDNASSAQVLDGQIQTIAGNAAEHLDYLADLLVEAKAGGIHRHLGFSSWTAYLADRLLPITRALDTDDRRALIHELHQTGMSLRAVAEAVGISKSSVARQLSQSGTGAAVSDSERQTTGLQGKGYARRHGGGGGHRGPLTPVMALKRLRSSTHNLAGLPEDAATLRDRICELMDQLIASLTAQLAELDVDANCALHTATAGHLYHLNREVSR